MEGGATGNMGDASGPKCAIRPIGGIIQSTSQNVQVSSKTLLWGSRMKTKRRSSHSNFRFKKESPRSSTFASKRASVVKNTASSPTPPATRVVTFLDFHFSVRLPFGSQKRLFLTTLARFEASLDDLEESILKRFSNCHFSKKGGSGTKPRENPVSLLNA